MRGWREKLSAVLGRILILGFGVQILWGLAFALSHLGSFQEFRESYFLERVGKTLICDEYTGILYPFLIRVFQGIGKVVPIPYFSMLYVLQLALAFRMAWFFMDSFVRWRRLPAAFKCWAALSVLTLPMAMQCHLAVLPNSLVSSFFLGELGLALRIMGARGYGAGEASGKTEAALTHGMAEGSAARGLAGMGACFLPATLLMPEYGLFGGTLLIGVSIYEVLKRGSQSKAAEENWIRRISGILLVAAVFLGLGSFLTRLTTREGAYGRIQKSVEAAAFLRTAWDDFGDLYPDWPKELKDALSQEEIALCNQYPLQKEWIIGRRVDSVYGRERAGQIYREMARVAGEIRFRRNAKEILKDFACYVFAPPMQLLLMEGWGHTTLSGRNFEVMRTEAPRLTTWYVRYSYTWFLAAFVLSLAMALLQLEKQFWKRNTLWRGAILFGGISLVLCLYYTMRGGGIMDYKNSISVTILWTVWCCYIAGKEFGGKEGASGKLEDRDHQK